jgi:hypothetical protein
MIPETLERIKCGNIAKLRKTNGKARGRAELNTAIKMMTMLDKKRYAKNEGVFLVLPG